MRFGAGLALAVALLVTVSCESQKSFGEVKTGSSLPDIRMRTLEGDKVRFGDYEGRPVLVNFWASNCIPCRKEFPLLKATLEANPDLVVIGVIFQDSPRAALRFMDSFEATWDSVDDPDEEVAKIFGVSRPPGIPQTFFVDASGVIKSRIFGEMSREVLDANLAKIIPSES